MRAICYILMLLPAALCVLYVRTFGVNVVFADQWEMVPHFARLANGQLSVSDLWAFHNEHQFFFPRVVMISLGSVTAWNNVAEMYFLVGCLAGSAVLLFVAFRKSLDEVRVRDLLVFVPVVWLVFSLRQHTNLLWGYQITFALTQLACLATLLLLYSGRWERAGLREASVFSLALALGLVASGSSAQGLLVWPAGLLLLALRKGTAQTLLVVWAAAGAITWGAYLAYRPSSGGGEPYGLSDFAGYFLTLLGNSLVSRPMLAVVCGVLVVSLGGASVLLSYRAGLLDRHAFWISLFFFSLMTLAGIAFGRAGFGLQTALASRYTTFSMLACMAVLVLLYSLWRETGNHLNGGLACVALALVLVSHPVSYYNGWQIGEQERSERERLALIVREYETRPEEQPENLRSAGGDMEQRIATLEQLEYNVFSEH